MHRAMATMAAETEWTRLADETISAFGGVDIPVNNVAAGVDTARSPTRAGRKGTRSTLLMRINN